MALLGLVTIGQAPRPDLEKEFRRFAPSAEIRLLGALDGLGRPDIDKLARPGDYPLHTRLSDGSTKAIPLLILAPLVEKRVQELAQAGARAVVVLCAGAFPDLEASVPVLLPGRIVPAVVKAIGRGRRIGLVSPLAAQIPAARAKWEADGFAVQTAFAGPGRRLELLEAARRLQDPTLDLVVLDCMGVGPEERREFAAACGRPVILPQTLVARVAGELVEI